MPNKRLLRLLIVVIVIVGCSFSVSAALYKSYVFDAWGNAVPTPEPYLPVQVLFGENLGVGSLRGARDIYTAPDNTFFITDSGNNRIIRTDSNFTVLEIYTEFERDGISDTFNSPSSVFVNDEGHIFVADTNNSRIVWLDENGNYFDIIESPAEQLPGAFQAHFRFRPKKIAVDSVDRLYVTIDGLFEGLLELDLEGNFRGFRGAPRVTPTFWQYLWSRVATEEQKQRMALILPTEYSSVDLDEGGFIYATIAAQDVDSEQFIRKLNPAGSDVLRREGAHPVIGDINIGFRSGITGHSRLVDVLARGNDIFSVLDQQRGRVFTYDGDGNLLYVFGGIGQGVGLFTTPVAIEEIDGRFLVLDNRSNSITVFQPTPYAILIHEAIENYYDGFYDEAAELWQQLITINANYELAYSGVADALLLQGEYEAAMHYFKLGNDREGYSKAFYRHRREVLGDNFGAIMTGILVMIGLVIVARRKQWSLKLKKGIKNSQLAATLSKDSVQSNRFVIYLKNTWRTLRYVSYVIFHPYDGFWDLKHENRGSLSAANILLFMVVVSYVFMRQYTGFVLNHNRIQDLNILVEFISIMIPFLLWTLVNWALTTLMDGKGKMKDIYIAGAYALAPMIFINIPITILSNFMTLDEGTFYYLVLAIGLIWAFTLLFVGAGVTHDYSFGKMIFTTLATIVGIGIVFFVGLLFFDVVDRMLQFGQELYTEFTFRL